jgi:hypothetical protein
VGNNSHTISQIPGEGTLDREHNRCYHNVAKMHEHVRFWRYKLSTWANSSRDNPLTPQRKYPFAVHGTRSTPRIQFRLVTEIEHA